MVRAVCPSCLEQRWPRVVHWPPRSEPSDGHVPEKPGEEGAAHSFSAGGRH